MGLEWRGSTQQLRPTRQQNVQRDSYVRSDSNNVQSYQGHLERNKECRQRKWMNDPKVLS